jgi:hypothetical protein
VATGWAALVDGGPATWVAAATALFSIFCFLFYFLFQIFLCIQI